MKKILLAFLAVALIFTACTTETVAPIVVGLSATSSSDITLPSSTKTIQVSVTNSSSEAATIKWERAAVTAGPSAWTYMVGSSSAMTGSITIAAGATTDVSVMIDPNGATGSTSGTLTFYDEADKVATTKVFAYSLSTVNSYFTTSPVGSLSQSARATNTQDYHISVINPNSVPVTLQWARTNETGNPTGWTVLVCTDELCYTTSILTEAISLGPTGSTIQPNDTVDFKATFDPTSVVGNGSTTALFYMMGDSANSAITHLIQHEGTL
jgi:hypothetical protein